MFIVASFLHEPSHRGGWAPSGCSLIAGAQKPARRGGDERELFWRNHEYAGRMRWCVPAFLAVGLLPLVLGACGGGSTATTTPAQQSTQAKPGKTNAVTISVLSVVQSQRSHDNPPKGASTGDNVKFEDVLLNATPQFGKAANARVGTDSGTMTFTSANTARMKGVTTLPDGTISFEGEVTVLPNKNLSVPVVGGTGKYANASGTLLVGSGTTSAPNTYSLILLGAALGPVA